MITPLPPNADFLLSKTDSELLYLAQNPDFYHPQLVATARRELNRRGVAIGQPPAVGHQAEISPAQTRYDQEAPARPWVLPAVGVGLAALAAGLFLWPASTPPVSRQAAAQPPAELVSVATHRLPTFDSLTAAQLRQMPATLPAAERTDTTAQRKYLLLARRFWEAENQSRYLFDQVVADKLDASFPGQVEITLDKWHRLTSALVYDHRLQPTMTRNLRRMEHVARIRLMTLQAQRSSYEVGAPVLTPHSLLMHDSILYVRQELLGVPAAQRIKPGTGAKVGRQDTAAVQTLAALPLTRPGHNPLYVLDGVLLASDPQTGEAPTLVSRLAADSIAKVVVLKGKMAMQAFGPRAHAGAILITTKRAAAAAAE